jgi:CheY-like chemotaxis protein
VYLPRVIEPSESGRSRDQSTMPVGTETVLLVEDEETVRELAAVVLAELGYRVLVANNGLEALQVAAGTNGHRIDLLLTDMVMPHLDGKHLAEILRSQRPDLRVLFCSGYSEDAIVNHGLLDQGTAFLQKPYTPGSLARKVREVLDARPAMVN